MKRVLILAILFAAIALVPVAAQDNPELDAAITRYMEVTKVKALTIQSIEQVEAQVPEAQRALVHEVIARVINIDEIVALTRKSMRKHFTLEEINALTDFYSSPIGASAMSKLPLVLTDTMPYLQENLAKVSQVVQQMYLENPALFESAAEEGEATEPSKE